MAKADGAKTARGERGEKLEVQLEGGGYIQLRIVGGKLGTATEADWKRIQSVKAAMLTREGEATEGLLPPAHPAVEAFGAAFEAAGRPGKVGDE